MNPRKLAEEARRHAARLVPYPVIPNSKQLLLDSANTLIAQADLLKRYREQKVADLHGGCYNGVTGDYRCEACRAYDELEKVE